MARTRARALRSGCCLVALAVPMLLSAPDARAEEKWGANDWYVGTSALFVKDNADPSTAKGSLDPSWGVNITAGYRHNRWLATELIGEYISRMRYSEKNGDGHGGLWLWSIMADGRLYLTDGRYQPYLLVGGGLIQKRDPGGGSSRTGTGFGTRFGAGVDLFTSGTFAVNLSATYVLPVTSQVSKRDYVTAGLGLTWY